ncbi:hypothetical protein [Stutzerimonas urumqiensis]|uniref:hypothetical protein n=1 Tax=Stutzerimonas urumqiensis TaxID=638269 RepID=UPI000EB0293F|nr:hypothetical protein [Stutzerimonas urumqiensis]
MKRTLLACVMAIAMPVLAQEIQIEKQLNGMDLEIEPLGVPGVSSDKVDLIGVPAIKVTNRSNEIASCQFHSLPEETSMTATPAFAIDPNEQAVMRVPGKYSAGGPIARLVCKPEGVPEREP